MAPNHQQTKSRNQVPLRCHQCGITSKTQEYSEYEGKPYRCYHFDCCPKVLFHNPWNVATGEAHAEDDGEFLWAVFCKLDMKLFRQAAAAAPRKNTTVVAPLKEGTPSPVRDSSAATSKSPAAVTPLKEGTSTPAPARAAPREPSARSQAEDPATPVAPSKQPRVTDQSADNQEVVTSREEQAREADSQQRDEESATTQQPTSQPTEQAAEPERAAVVEESEAGESTDSAATKKDRKAKRKKEKEQEKSLKKHKKEKKKSKKDKKKSKKEKKSKRSKESDLAVEESLTCEEVVQRKFQQAEKEGHVIQLDSESESSSDES